MSNAREDILSRIAQARRNRKGFELEQPDWESPIYKVIDGSPEECFVRELEAVSGFGFVGESEMQVFEALKARLAEHQIERLFCRESRLSALLTKYGIAHSTNEADFKDLEAGVTACEFLVARTGSVMNSSALESGRQVHAYSPIHIVIAGSSQIKLFLPDALEAIREKYGESLPSAITNITGPSRTADIEKTLILGAHGPKAIWVFIDKSA